jgi:elongation factor 1 alpha-like protein
MKARQSSSIAQPQPPEPSSRQASPTVAVVTKALQSVTLEQTSAITTAVTIKSTPLRIPLDRIEQEWLKRQGERPNLNLVVIGHVDAGKSTLMGHLLHLLGEIDRRTVDRYERDSQQVGKGSFHFAWVLDATAEERER